MKLTFLGTRGEIEARTERHRRHSSLEVSHRGRRVMIERERLARLGRERGVRVELAYDGMEVVLR